MKVVILAGGFGTRISEESHLKPKPMIEIGSRPVIWHIMKIYSYYGFNDFVICLGYKGYVIKEYFANYYLLSSDVTFDFSHENKVTIHNNVSEPWKVTLVDTGLNTMTGGRVKNVEPYLDNEPFMLTYGDGVSDINLKTLLSFHKQHGKSATITAVRPGGRYGVLDITKGDKINAFREKVRADESWVNGGFMVLNPDIFKYIAGEQTSLEREPLEKLSSEGQLMAYKHTGFWQCMDTQRDKTLLESLWESNKSPWKVW